MGGEDSELRAMGAILDALDSLDTACEKTRVLAYIVGRLNLEGENRIKVEFDNKDD